VEPAAAAADALQTFRAASSAFVKSSREGGEGEAALSATEYMHTFLALFGKQANPNPNPNPNPNLTLTRTRTQTRT